MSIQVTASAQDTTEQSGETSTESASESSPAPEPEEDLPLDVVFDILSVQRRRQVLNYLFTESETTTLSDLAEHIAAIENDKPEAALSSKERKRVYVGLYQCHLPRMDDAGVIDYESNRGTVQLGPNAELVASYLPDDDSSDDDRQLPTTYLAVALAGAGSFVGQSVLYPHALLAGFSIGLFVSSVCLAALTHDGSEWRWPSGLEFLDPSSDESAA